MSDIVGRLRQWAKFGYGVDASATMIEAADEIERLTRQFAEHADRTADDTAALRAENERLRALVEEAYREGFDEGKDGGWIVGPSVPWKSSEARAALDAQPAPGKEGENE